MATKPNKVVISFTLVATILASLGLSACGDGTPATTTNPAATTFAPTTTPATTPTATPTTTPTVTPTTTPTTTPTATPTIAPTSGPQLYTASCASCHGANRQGIKSGETVVYPPILPTSPGVSTRTETQLAFFLSGHATSINMTNDQRAALTAFLKNP